MEGVSLPFTIHDLYGGFAEVRGLLRLADKALVLEFQTQDAVLNVLKMPLEETTLPFDQLVSVGFTSKWFGYATTLSIKTKTMKSLAGVPGSGQGELRLAIARVDRDKAQELVSRVNLQLSEAALGNVRTE